MVTVSTDYVFDGTKPEPYVEWDTPNPPSVYGQSKLGGEITDRYNDRAPRVGVRPKCAPGRNMVKTILSLAGARDAVVRRRSTREPSFTEDLAVMIRRLAVDRRPGLFHVTNQGAVSWFRSSAGAVLAAAGLVLRE